MRDPITLEYGYASCFLSLQSMRKMRFRKPLGKDNQKRTFMAIIKDGKLGNLFH